MCGCRAVWFVSSRGFEKRVVHLHPASSLPAPHLAPRKRSPCHCVDWPYSYREWISIKCWGYNYPSFIPNPPPPSTVFPFCHWRKANSRAAYSNKSCCLSASLEMITCLPVNCLSTLPPSCHLQRFTKKPGEGREKKETIFFVKCCVSATGFTIETFIIIFIKAKRVIFPAQEHFPVPERLHPPYL